MSDTSYTEKRSYFDRMLTLYGRKPALEALRDRDLDCQTLHLAHSNREGGIVGELLAAAEQRGVTIKRHSREELARISRNGKQDQGVALDVLCPAFQSVESYLNNLEGKPRQRLLALDGITNPQNIGMIVRSAAAGNIDGLLWSRKGNAAPGPLVVKASAGTLYRAPVLTCQALPEALQQCQHNGFEVCTLEADARIDLFAYRPAGHCIYVLGNETDGVSAAVSKLAQQGLSIPMNNGVESLNVAVTASLIAYADRM
ncbi:23S rRNA (guanosine(2251)-2'-O)-methyltransferase RlmB [Halioglobus sp. HI00S01]|uniref:TrmH family RNA methyltransferase n=1 Tax=Halioglobus sp. HI00S01 TaxID=1822214 RepID=UPI0007C320B8|nr:RNA methyltransferase [Halioglobus sp. HI00S01]KZX60196.1 23S rRNA (guanosine(2251)-2'-O)-methyltransferase RlmB [Halioglobus sp. HI00S01]